MISAHESPLAAIAFDMSGTKLATASNKVNELGQRVSRINAFARERSFESTALSTALDSSNFAAESDGKRPPSGEHHLCIAPFVQSRHDLLAGVQSGFDLSRGVEQHRNHSHISARQPEGEVRNTMSRLWHTTYLFSLSSGHRKKRHGWVTSVAS